KKLMRIVMGLPGQADLLQVVHALRAAGCFTRSLHGWQQQRDEDANDRNHDEQFDQCKSAMTTRFHEFVPLNFQTIAHIIWARPVPSSCAEKQKSKLRTVLQTRLAATPMAARARQSDTGLRNACPRFG